MGFPSGPPMIPDATAEWILSDPEGAQAEFKRRAETVRTMTTGMTKTQEHALAVIRGFGGTVWISPVTGRPCCGWHQCTFTVDTVRALAARGLLRRADNKIEQYELVQPAPEAPR